MRRGAPAPRQRPQASCPRRKSEVGPPMIFDILHPTRDPGHWVLPYPAERGDFVAVGGSSNENGRPRPGLPGILPGAGFAPWCHGDGSRMIRFLLINPSRPHGPCHPGVSKHRFFSVSTAAHTPAFTPDPFSPMYRYISFAVLILGVVLISYGVIASDSLSSDISRFFTGSPTDRTMWLLIVGLLATAFGLYGVFRSPSQRI